MGHTTRHQGIIKREQTLNQPQTLHKTANKGGAEAILEVEAGATTITEVGEGMVTGR